MHNILINGLEIQKYQIMCLSDDSAVLTAKQELQDYLKTEQGTIGKIYLGLCQDIPCLANVVNRVDIEGIYIKICNQDVYIAGGSGRAVIYAVYEFLERFCGWRFFTPDVETEPVGTVNLENTEYLFNPPWEYRMNLVPTSGAGTSHFRKRHLNARWGFDPEPEELGSSITFAGHSGHTFQFLIPDTVYFDEHPEYFAMNGNGERVMDKVCGTQPCLSHPKVFEIVLENLRKDLRAHPNARFASVSQNDGGVFCQCEACRKINEEEQTDGGTIFRFVNRIAEAIEDEFPNVLIETLAYNFSTKPPVKTVMRDNVSVCLCLMIACREHTISDESCSYNEKLRQYLADWSKSCKFLRIWDYYANFNNYPICLPNFKLLYQNMKRLRCHTVKGIMYQGAHSTDPDIEFSALWGYLQSKLCWNPDMSYVEYLNCAKEFLQAYYGGGGTFIYEYLMLRMMQPSSDYHYGPVATCEQILPMLHLPDGSPDMTFIQDANDLFDLAEAAATAEALERVKRSRLHLTWYEICTTYKYIRENGTEEEINALREKYEAFHNIVSKWEGFKISEGIPYYGTPFDFDRDPNSFIVSLF